MNQLQIESLRDFAIEHLTRAQLDREQINRFGSTQADFYRRLAVTAVMVRSKAGATAIEYAAANVLETVSLLCAEREEPLPKPTSISLLQRLTRDAKELCNLTGRTITWLDTLPTVPEPEEELPAAPVAQKPAPSIAGRFLTTEEAAKALNVKAQTLREWASTQSGPIQPCSKVGRHHRWSGDEILAHLTSAKPATKKK